MKTTSSWNFGFIVGRAMMGLALAAMIGSIDVAPAFAKNDKHKGKQYQGRGPGGPGYQHNRTVYRTRTVYQPYGYRERVYAPPPVYYAPPPSPGIGIFFPPIFIHP